MRMDMKKITDQNDAGLLAKNPADISQDSFFTRNLNKLSLLIYRKFLRKRQLPGAENVRACLSALYDTRNLKEVEENYYVNKISVVLLVLIAGGFLALMLHFSTIHDTNVEDGNAIRRKSPGQGEQKIELTAKNGEGEMLGNFDVTVDEQRYSVKEAQALFEKASRELGPAILGDNKGLDEVTTNLNLVKKLEGYPFEIFWRSEDYELIAYDGEIALENIPKEGVSTSVTATFKYDDSSWQQVINITLMPRELTAEEKARKNIEKLIQKADMDSRYDEEILLPESYEEDEITWSERKEDDSLILLLLMWIAGFACFSLKDKELGKKAQKRKEELLKDYPQLVSQLVLYLGAGMTVRNIFSRLADEYVRKRDSGMAPGYMQEELLRMVRALRAGQSEAKAYEEFGQRCQCQEYTRLCTLLAQNLRKGNGEILCLLQEESKKAFDSRMDAARKRGEEAGTKLLLPMILMLLIVMIVIMIPAYLTF